MLTHGRPSVLRDSRHPSARSCYKCSEPSEPPSVARTDPEYFLHGFNKHQSFQEHHHHVDRKEAGLFWSQMLPGVVHHFPKASCPPRSDGTPVVARVALGFLMKPHGAGAEPPTTSPRLPVKPCAGGSFDHTFMSVSSRSHRGH